MKTIGKLGSIIVVFCLMFQLSACQKRGGHEEKKETDITEVSRVVSQEEESKEEISKLASIESIRQNLEKIGKYVRSYQSDTKHESVDYIENTLRQYGYKTEIQKFDIKRPESLLAMSEKSPEEMFDIIEEDREILGKGQDIIARHDSNKNEKKTLYITAHYDTTDFTTGVIDNGTGVAVVLETAKVLEQLQTDINVVFVFFDGEEVGLQGAKYFVYNLIESEKEDVIGCINIDMVGEKEAGDLMMKFRNGEHNILSILWNHTLENKMSVGLGFITDEQAFYYDRLPAVTIENQNPNFSLDKEENQFQYINYQQMLNLTNELIDFIKNFDLDYYEKALEEQIEVKSNLKNVCQIENADFKRATAKVVDNGFLLETCFYYETYDQQEFQISLRKGIFFRDKNLEAYQKILDGENTINYKIESLEGGKVQALYFTEDYFGTIKGDLDEERCIQILKSFNKAEYWQNYF